MQAHAACCGVVNQDFANQDFGKSTEAAGPTGIPGQPIRHCDQTTVRRTSTLPRVALEYGHT